MKDICLSVNKGSHFATLVAGVQVPFYGVYKRRSFIYNKIKFDESATRYRFDANDTNGTKCQMSWNKFFGATRCSQMQSYDQDSVRLRIPMIQKKIFFHLIIRFLLKDRFAWRRTMDCLIFNGSYVIGEKCASQIEIAAYAFDNVTSENSSSLIQIFQTKLSPNKWYGFRIELNENSSVYDLIDAETSRVLEQKRVDHRTCSQHNTGIVDMLYFGGDCAAPQKVSVCYSNTVTARFFSKALLLLTIEFHILVKRLQFC